MKSGKYIALDNGEVVTWASINVLYRLILGSHGRFFDNYWEAWACACKLRQLHERIEDESA